MARSELVAEVDPWVALEAEPVSVKFWEAASAGLIVAESDPVPREVLIVARDRRDLYERLQRLRARDSSVEIILDRRVQSAVRQGGVERRVHDISRQLASMGYAVVESAARESA